MSQDNVDNVIIRNEKKAKLAWLEKLVSNSLRSTNHVIDMSGNEGELLFYGEHLKSQGYSVKYGKSFDLNSPNKKLNYIHISLL